jgi:cation:H+ antiporter
MDGDGTEKVGRIPARPYLMGCHNRVRVEWVELLVAIGVILASAELFTNGIEWVGIAFGLSEGVVGSVLAAVGTALPETILPLVAILSGRSAGEEIGIGAILGAPFMLTTLAMFVLGASVLLFSRHGGRSTDVVGDRRVIVQDLGYFLVMYLLAVVAGLFHPDWFRWGLAVGLMVGYALYVRRHFAAPAPAVGEQEARGELATLYLARFAPGIIPANPGDPADPPPWASVSQSLLALVGMVGGARIFVAGIDTVARDFGVPQLALALLLAPFATELPEKFNSVIWAHRGKDTLALGNLTGAMVFQSSFPVTVGLLLTPWRLTGDALVAALVALAAGTVLWVTVRVRGLFPARLLLLQGVFYAAFVTYVIVRL